MNELAKIQEICQKNNFCKFCRLHDKTENQCPIDGKRPDQWDIDKILEIINSNGEG